MIRLSSSQIAGNKCDLQAKRKIPAIEALNASSILGALNIFEFSAKKGEKIEDIFKLLAIKRINIMS